MIKRFVAYFTGCLTLLLLVQTTQADSTNKACSATSSLNVHVQILSKQQVAAQLPEHLKQATDGFEIPTLSRCLIKDGKAVGTIELILNWQQGGLKVDSEAMRLSTISLLLKTPQQERDAEESPSKPNRFKLTMHVKADSETDWLNLLDASALIINERAFASTRYPHDDTRADVQNLLVTWHEEAHAKQKYLLWITYRYNSRLQTDGVQ